MEVSGLKGLQYDEDKALKSLLDTFESVFSLKEIASAYCEAGRNPYLAGQILFEMQGVPSFVATDQSKSELKNAETSGSSSGICSQGNGCFMAPKQNKQPVSAARNESNGKARNDEYLDSSCGNRNFCEANGDLRAPKQIARSVSGGTVSSMTGTGYMKSVPLANGSYPGTKPTKLDSKEMPMSLFWGEGLKSSSRNEDRLHKDMEDFLFKMLGEGFRLERGVIREVLDSCGYNMQKSMEKLLERPAVSVDKDHESLGKCKKTNDTQRRVDEPSQERMNRVSNANVGERPRKNQNGLQKDVLAALFDASERFDELPRTTVQSTKRPIALGEIVEGPLIDVTAKPKVNRILSQENTKDDEDKEDTFQTLRRAVMEYRGTMKEYYKAAVDAFAKGDQDRANRHLEEGQFYREKARQADEESNHMIFVTKNTETENEMLLELHDHGAKEAIQLLKCHLSSLAGIPSFKYLKVIVDTNEEDSSKGARRRLVMKLLQKESISWIEGETSGILLIRLDTINPKRLSFAKT